MKKLILVSGKARSGKDSFVNFLTEDLDSCQVLDITGGLKDVVAGMFKITRLELEESKDERAVEFCGIMDADGDCNTKEYTIRHFLQYIGNDIAPMLMGKFYWCMERQEKMFSVDRDINILCGVRQLKELEFFKSANPDKKVIVVKLERTLNGKPYSPIIDKAHATETEVDLLEADYTFSCENLEEIKNAANELKKIL